MGSGHLDGRHIFHDVPETLKVLSHLAPAASDETILVITSTIEGATGNIELFQESDVLPRHLPITKQITGSNEVTDTTTDEVGLAVFNLLRHFRTRFDVLAHVILDETIAKLIGGVRRLVNTHERTASITNNDRQRFSTFRKVRRSV